MTRPLSIDLHYQSGPPFGPNTHETQGIGGTENFATYAAEYLARRGHLLRFYNQIQAECRVDYLGGGSVHWCNLAAFNLATRRDVLISFRFRDVFKGGANARLKVLMLADTESVGLGDQVRAGQIDLVGFVGEWQRRKIALEEGIPDQYHLQTSNGVALERFDTQRGLFKREKGRCVHLSTPERGLPYLLEIWPFIEARVPWATLHLFSSFKGWGVSDDHNLRMTEAIYEDIEDLRAQGYHIINHTHASGAQIREHLLRSELFLYPTRHFDETCCISAIEAAAAGVPIVATARGALTERVDQFGTGYLVPDVDGHDRYFAAKAIGLLLNQDLWNHMSAASVQKARGYDYAAIVEAWERRFRRELGNEATLCREL